MNVKIGTKYFPANPAGRTMTHFASRECSAFTLPEVLCASMLIGLAVTSIYLGLGQGYTFTEENTLNARAAQIIAEKMETIRLYTWDQVNDGVTVPTAFTNYYYPYASTNTPSSGTNEGVMFTGTVTITNTALGGTEAYSNDVRQVTVNVNWYPGANWTSGSKLHQLQATTFVAHYGMQNYVYGTK